MIPQPWDKALKLVVIAVIIIVIVCVGYIAFLFDQGARQSERHVFHYSIDLSCNTTLENVTLMLPFPEMDGTPFPAAIPINETLYGVPAYWNLSTDTMNGSPMLAIRAERMVPEYHGYPIAIEPGQSPLPTTRVPGTEYSEETPILQPIHLGMMIPVNRTIATRDPIGQEPLFAPRAEFTPGEETTGPYEGKEYTHNIPVFVEYTSEHPAAVYIRVSIRGTNSIWKGGWVYNGFEDSVTLDLSSSPGWVNGQGVLRTGEGVYYS